MLDNLNNAETKIMLHKKYSTHNTQHSRTGTSYCLECVLQQPPHLRVNAEHVATVYLHISLLYVTMNLFRITSGFQVIQFQMCSH